MCDLLRKPEGVAGPTDVYDRQAGPLLSHV